MIKEAKNTRENPAQPVVTETIIQQEDTIDLVELFWVLVNHWKIILLTMLITAMLAGVYYLVGVKPSYQADRIYQVVGSSEPTVIDYSEAEAVDEITPALTKYLAIGLLLGLIAACGLICVRYMTDTTLKTEDDLKRYLDIPVLSVVPYYEEKKE